MDILDIFSWLPAKEMSLEKIEQMIRLLYEGAQGNDKYRLEMQLPMEADNNIVEVTEELLGEGKKDRITIGKAFIDIAAKYGMTIRPCAEGNELAEYGADCSGCMTVKTFETALQQRLDVPIKLSKISGIGYF